MRYREDDEADLDEREFPEPDPEEDEDDTQTCPYCGAPVYAGAERCPLCANYLSEEDVPVRRPWWFILGVVLCLAVALGWAVWG
jgi:hypothetical protein